MEDNSINRMVFELCPNGIEYKKLENCCKILDNNRKPISKANRKIGIYPYYGANGIQDYVDDYIFNGTYILVGEDGSVMNSNGNPIVNWASGKIWVNNHAHIIEEINGIKLKYLYYCIQTLNISGLVHGNIPKLNQECFRNLEIPIPPLPIQEKIVEILDTFDEYNNSMISGLKGEIEKNQKRYEYYRDTLLTFERKVV